MTITSTACPVTELEELACGLQALTTVSWSRQDAAAVKEALAALERITRAASAIRLDALAEVDRAKSWQRDGQRTMEAWVASRTGSTRNNAFKAVGLSQTMHDLPQTRKALAGGLISEDHAHVIARQCTKSDKLRKRLADPRSGEGFLLKQAGDMDATRFARVVKAWAVETDPKTADREWRKESAKEELTVVQTEDGCRIKGWFTPENGALISAALQSHMGRKAADDTRSFPQRQAAGLLSLCKQSLDAGFQMPNARIRPHMIVSVEYDTLTRLAKAHGDSMPDDAGYTDPAQWAREWKPGDDHVISSTLDYDLLTGAAPATLADGTPLAPSLLARLACNSLMSRVVFGPDSTILDSGREERIFTPSQTRAIIARDGHCQFPGCDETPSRCEVHHSLEWFKHNGSTHVDLGVLLCWHHHDVVHKRQLTIKRRRGKWKFTNTRGAPVKSSAVSSAYTVPT